MQRIAEKRAKILRPILGVEKKGLSVSQALEDAAWQLGLVSKPSSSLGTSGCNLESSKMHRQPSKSPCGYIVIKGTEMAKIPPNL